MGIRISHKPDMKAMKAQMFLGFEKAVRTFALEATEELKTRTSSKGVDAEGRQFKQYTPRYARYKARKTRTSAPRVNLTLTGKMLQAIQSGFEISGGRYIGRIFPVSNEAASKIKGNNEARRFFAISKDQAKAFREMCINFIRRKLK